MIDDPNDRFGFTSETIGKEVSAHARAGLLRDGCYVPTRCEVAEMEAGSLIPILRDWFWESPSSLIPSDAQIIAVLDILRERSDAAEFDLFIRENDPFGTNADEVVTSD